MSDNIKPEDELQSKYDKAIQSLKYIEQGMGPYKRDQLEFAHSTIESMKQTAKKCLDDLGVDRTNYDPYKEDPSHA